MMLKGLEQSCSLKTLQLLLSREKTRPQTREAHQALGQEAASYTRLCHFPLNPGPRTAAENKEFYKEFDFIDI